MRIVGGALRGRKLRVPSGKLTRPTTERVREALFNTLGTTVQDCAVLDLYAGSGSLGIEALSRGARLAVFVEMAGSAASVLRENLSRLPVNGSAVAHVIQRSISHSMSAISAFAPFGLCLVDPPFAAVRDCSAMRAVEMVVAAGVLSPNATVVFEYPSDEPEPLLGGLERFDIRSYGDTSLAFCQLVGATSTRPTNQTANRAPVSADFCTTTLYTRDTFEPGKGHT